MKTLLFISIFLISYRMNEAVIVNKQPVADKLVNHILRVSKNGKASLVSKTEASSIAKSIRAVSKNKDIPEAIIVAIIHSESNFVQSAVSSSGDVSLAQINMRVWEEFLVKKGFSIDEIKTNPDTAIRAMGEILSVYKKNNKDWYGNYHSKTKKYKGIYLKKVNKNMRSYALGN